MAIDKVVSLEEVNRSWNLDDIMQANAVLDFQRDAEAANQPKGRGEQ